MGFFVKFKYQKFIVIFYDMLLPYKNRTRGTYKSPREAMNLELSPPTECVQVEINMNKWQEYMDRENN